MEAVQVELPDEGLEPVVSEVLGQHLLDECLFVADDDFRLFPKDNLMVGAVLENGAELGYETSHGFDIFN